ncbi:proline--tRNA ligase [Reticulibacter mediterranei]|uniref:Proline--tRNA ligase n=1 Tax=Reticulibacter mediterranei TaxID=2778369 RepID=A0A8J3N236_9CHLR|nr:proline--tRNA ligase [Reticulibacter mediterranei]GHO91907.1 proline--tRNA ligase [Reticulibacter mediterranei]
MRVSQLLTTTLREAPRDAEGSSHELLLRAGFIRQLTSGVYSYLPLGNQVLRNIMQIVREEMDRIGGQEVILPVLQPEEIWDQHPAFGGPSRLELYGPVLFRLRDRKERAMVIAPTHEEASALLAKEFLRSYRDLPQLLYQFQVKLRDEPRPRGGLLRVREFLMKDLYSFDADQAGLDRSFERVKAAYQAIFLRCELAFLGVQADSGAIGGKESLEFVALTEAGEDTILKCVNCDYAANQEKAEFVRTALPAEPKQPLEEVYTPGCMAISDLAAYLNISAAKTMKAVCYVAGDRMVLVVVRGDLEVNEVKLSNTLNRAGVNSTDLHLATPEELTREGIVAGYTSPLQKDEHILIIADTSLQQGNNFVAGANRVDYHVQHVNYPRDFRVDLWADIASAYDHATCVYCGGTLHAFRGCELGHIFKIGTRYADLFDVTYLDAEGNAHPVQMGSYGIGIGRLMALIVEQWHDDKGIIWPLQIAPYQIALLGLDLDKTSSVAEQLYTDLTVAGLSVLFDDRAETAGVKFNDADLIGLPLRVVVSKRSLKNGGVELKWRARRESRIVPVEDAVQAIQAEIRNGL